MPDGQNAGELPAAPKTFVQRRGLWGLRLRLIIALFAICMLTLSVQRLIIFLATRMRYGEVSRREIATGFALGLRFDVVIALLAIFPLLIALAAAPGKALVQPWF